MLHPRSLVLLGVLAVAIAAGARSEIRQTFNLMYERLPLDESGTVDRSEPPMRFYFKGQRSRIDGFSMEGGAPRLQTSSIMDCDSSRMITVNWSDRSYTLMTFEEFQQMQRQAMEMAGRMQGIPGVDREEDREGGTVIESTAWSDSTAGRRFGLPVRYVGQVSTREASADACSPGESRQETHRWVTDLEVPLCIPPFVADGVPAMGAVADGGGGCRDSVVTRTTGRPRPFTFVLREEHIDTRDGRRIVASGFEVVTLSRDTLADSLFVPPAGFEQRDMGAALAAAGAAAAADEPPPVRPKAPGTTRVAVAVRLSGAAPTTPADAADRVVDWISGQPGYDAVRVVAADMAAAVARAPDVDADYVLFYDVEAEAKVSGRGMLGGIVGGAIGQQAAGGAMKVEAEGQWDLVAVDGAPVSDGDVDEEKGGDDPADALGEILQGPAEAALAAIRR